MEMQFDGLSGNRVRGFAAASKTIVRQSLWLVLLLLGWASTAQAAIPAAERQVLLDLYASTNGASWTTNTNWNGAVGTECTWHGILCDGAQSHIAQISLDSNNLVGILPSLGELTALQYFAVKRNQLTGAIPSLSGLTALQDFAAQRNQLTGSIPSLSGLMVLQTFAVNYNQLTGSIPSLSGLTALQNFYVNSNQLTGTIPSLSGLTALQSFALGSNQLTGSIPSLSGLTALQYFYVDSNQLTGPVSAAPTSLLVGESMLCGNSLVSSGDTSIDAAWTTATGTDWLACQTAAITTLYTLSVTRSGSGTGSITSNTGGIDCGTTCWADYASGSSVTLTATPATGSYFVGWSGDCSSAGSCVVTMSAAKNITAIFKLKPFVATPLIDIKATSATITNTIAFNAADKGKQGSVFVTAWVPANGLRAFGISTAALSKAMSVTTISDNPYLAGKLNSRQVPLNLLAATDPNAFVLVQLTPSGWQLVVDGQLIPYASGVLGDSLAAQSILNNTDPTNLTGAQFCVGYGTSDTEMIASGRMLPVAIIPASSSTATTSGSCNVTDVVVEFYNTNLDNYFITADPNEAAQIDGGAAGPGWSRTGNTFKSGGKASVCRFYGSYSPGPNSHFYTVDPGECQGLKDQQFPAGDPRKLTVKSWNFESLDFVSTPPTTTGVSGTCPTGTTPVYRAYNNGFSRGVDSNHRITSSTTAIQEVVTRGWSNEGVVMCAPN